jgi:methylenetetrahydrofolate dehydrogenase (NADP+)/methenyltetrahydrofolate cyclohydrolase/formyltetrahydrofolate synthetase
MGATKLDGTAIAKRIRARLAAEIVEKQVLNPRYKPTLKIIQGTLLSFFLLLMWFNIAALCTVCRVKEKSFSTDFYPFLVGDRTDSCAHLSPAPTSLQPRPCAVMLM